MTLYIAAHKTTMMASVSASDYTGVMTIQLFLRKLSFRCWYGYKNMNMGAVQMSRYILRK